MENVKRFFNSPLVAISSIFFVCFVVAISSFFRGCSKSVENVANNATEKTVESIIQQNKIEGLQRQIEALTKDVEQLEEQNIVIETKIQQIDSLRLNNFANNRNQSLQQSYSDLSNRYTKQKTNR